MALRIRSTAPAPSISTAASPPTEATLPLQPSLQPLPPSPEIHKTALGAEDSVDWTYEADTLDAVRRLKAQGWTVLAVEQVEASTMLGDFVPCKGRHYAVVLGNEVKGVRQDVVDECDGCIEIPQHGTKHSLNVSVTAGIVIWDIYNKLAAIGEAAS